MWDLFVEFFSNIGIFILLIIGIILCVIIACVVVFLIVMGIVKLISLIGERLGL
jgi:hypothetical protein